MALHIVHVSAWQATAHPSTPLRFSTLVLQTTPLSLFLHPLLPPTHPQPPCSFASLLLQTRNEPLSEDAARFYAGCVILGLEYMHDRNIAWRWVPCLQLEVI